MEFMLAEVIRSLVLPEAFVTAHIDKMVLYRPRRGVERRIRLPSRVTSLLACSGPCGNTWRLFVGDFLGNVHLLSLPSLEILESHQLGNSSISALTHHSSSRGQRVLAGLQTGEVFALGEAIPGGKILLFKHDREISMLRTVDELITIHSGWERDVRHWNGDYVSPARNWLHAPEKPTRSKQLTLTTPAPA